MPKYLTKASYTQEGLRGLMKDGGTKRRDAVEALCREAGLTMEGFYFAFGDTDVYVITDGPDNVSAASVSLTVSASGAVTTETVPLLTPEEIDEAVKKSPAYSPPGS